VLAWVLTMENIRVSSGATAGGESAYACRGAARAAGRPITTVQVAALACAMGIAGPASAPPRRGFSQRCANSGPPRLPLLDSAASAIAAHGVLAIALVTLLLLLGEAKRNPLAPEAILAEDRRLAAYGARQAKKVGFKERGAVRMIHESRARRDAS